MYIQENIPLAQYTTLKVGGAARYLVEVASVDELIQAQQFALQIAAPVLLLGTGSNVLVSDQGFPGLVIKTAIQGVEYLEQPDDSVCVTVGAGVELDQLVQETAAKGLWGLENLSHIPGTVGAAPIQNVGAYGVEVSSLIDSVKAVSILTGEHKQFSNTECHFSYRDSYFKTDAGRNWCVTSVTLILSSVVNPVLKYGDLQQLDPTTVTAQEIRDTVIKIRSGKFPDWHTVGTAGSFFKNPIVEKAAADHLVQLFPELPFYPQPDGRVKLSLGWILDKVCGLRGHTVGAVGLYEHQALVLINTGDSASAITAFVEEVQQTMLNKTGIAIEPEVRIV